MSEQQVKRSRLACLNCRRKKTRCPGERPVCSFCSRLGQACRYNDNVFTYSDERSAATYFQQGIIFPEPFVTNEQDAASDATVAAAEPQSSSVYQFSNPETPLSWDRPSNVRFDSLPNSEVVRSLVNTYFQFCHCQPYCYFQESSFRRRLSSNSTPKWLLLAVIATASGFSTLDYFQARQAEAADCYALCAWKDIHARIFQEDFITIQVVQATNMLAVIDFTAGRYTEAWVKIGLSIRLAQALDLVSEPDPSLLLWQQEEHRRTFWSVYLLDRIVSCSPERSPAILDTDCALFLPVDQTTLSPSPQVAQRITLACLTENKEELGNLGYSGLLCLLASTLGRIQRYNLRRRVPASSFLPWNSESEFASIYSVLLTCESYSPSPIVNFEAVLDQNSAKMANEQNHNSMLGVFCFSHALYFLNQCLLHHPFLIRHHLQSLKAPIPPSFLRHALVTSRENATSLTCLLQTLMKRRLCLASSLGYCALVAGVTHRLFENDGDSLVRQSSREMYDATVDFLCNAPVSWLHFPRLAHALRSFAPDPEASSYLVSSSLLANVPQHPDAEVMWKLLDYGKSSRYTKEAITESELNASSPNGALGSWVTQLDPHSRMPDMSDFDRAIYLNVEAALCPSDIGI
ncbi:hypothetical protein TGAM01_v206010 [Trichoderma gamsii]|uniref:Zn(2)-C6 fungal-type domain-containing protein n=1 Tax=Trichoderma gamsii TaxID=398673 RepID=A0A2P4ZKW3_9HYPO|nr:hypothetical protein TGAM01_v206010 [Trichoderma gamsii]PON24929.1 hypothetical protein TGAM01_v206010 [Trichoderma gamsii]